MPKIQNIHHEKNDIEMFFGYFINKLNKISVPVTRMLRLFFDGSGGLRSSTVKFVVSSYDLWYVCTHSTSCTWRQIKQYIDVMKGMVLTALLDVWPSFRVEINRKRWGKLYKGHSQLRWAWLAFTPVSSDGVMFTFVVMLFWPFAVCLFVTSNYQADWVTKLEQQIWPTASQCIRSQDNQTIPASSCTPLL